MALAVETYSPLPLADFGPKKENQEGWFGYDLDGTAAKYFGWSVNGTDIGEPVPAIAARIKRHLAVGAEVRIFTARACSDNPKRVEDMRRIQDWTEKHFGQRLRVTAEKDFAMLALFDDRAIAVKPNTGECLSWPERSDCDPITPSEEIKLLETRPFRRLTSVN